MYIYIYICRGCGQGFRLVTALHWPFFASLKPLRRYTRNWLAPLQMLKPPGCCTRHKASMNLHKPLPGLLELSWDVPWSEVSWIQKQTRSTIGTTWETIDVLWKQLAKLGDVVKNIEQKNRDFMNPWPIAWPAMNITEGPFRRKNGLPFFGSQCCNCWRCFVGSTATIIPVGLWTCYQQSLDSLDNY